MATSSKLKESSSRKTEHLDTKSETLRVYEAEKMIVPIGGKIQLVGCCLSVPGNALSEERRLKMKIIFLKRKQYIEDGLTLFGSELDLGPDGTKFSQPATVSVPTCYAGKNGQEAAVEIQTRENGDEPWQHCQTVSVTQQGNIEFSVLHFSLYRFLMRMLGIEKSIAHMSFTRQNDGNEYEMIWCFCDNLREARLEVKKEMSLQEFNLTKSTETFIMSASDNIRVSLEIDECEIEDLTQIIPADDLWFSDSNVKVEFIIRNLQAGKSMNYKIEKIRDGDDDPYFSKENSFTFQPKTGRLDLGSPINIIEPKIAVMKVG